MIFSPIEREVIFLKAIEELIDSMVNYEVLSITGVSPHSEIRFKSTTHQKYFNIILVDFLSCSDKKVIGEQLSYLSALTTICQTPCFDKNGSINGLSVATKEFIDWLEQEVQVETWLPSIDKNMALLIKRIEFLKICGNISKHNFSRLSGTANDMLGVLKRNQVNIDLKEALVVLDDFYEKFHFDILSYHASTICEFLNNIRWGIYEYLRPEFHRSFVWKGGSPPSYEFTYPNDVKTDFAKHCYWDLMNEVRSVPYVPRFQVTRWLKLNY